MNAMAVKTAAPGAGNRTAWPLVALLRTSGTVAGVIALTKVRIEKGGWIALLLLGIGALVWKIVQWDSVIRLRILAFALLDLTFWTLAGWLLHFFDIAASLKYDAVLENIDSRWLFDPAWCRSAMHLPGIAPATNLVYFSLAYVAIAWYGWQLAQGAGWKMIQSLIVAYAVGPLFYLLVPAYGPLRALSGRPNCMPSLHLATAILLVIYRPRKGFVLGLLFALATAWAALASGEHYVIDLVMAIPFSAFVWAAVERRWIPAGLLLSLVTTGVLAIRISSTP